MFNISTACACSDISREVTAILEYLRKRFSERRGGDERYRALGVCCDQLHTCNNSSNMRKFHVKSCYHHYVCTVGNMAVRYRAYHSK